MPLPTDAELLTLVRQRLHTVTEAILDYLHVVELTGQERQLAFERYLAIRNVVGVHGPGTAENALRFIEAYADTLPARRVAAEALQAALTTDWRTEILCAADMTDEQRVELLGRSAP